MVLCLIVCEGSWLTYLLTHALKTNIMYVGQTLKWIGCGHDSQLQKTESGRCSAQVHGPLARGVCE
jgi:hypothetical protein